MSCVSLTSSLTPTISHSHTSSSSSQFSAGYSTAPTSPGSPILENPFDTINVKILEGEALADKIAQPASVPLPIDLRPASRNVQLQTTEEQGEEAYRPNPKSVAVRPRPKRQNFNFWADMPYELKISILRWLSPKEVVACSGVSKAWHDLCFDGQLWTTLDTQTYYSEIPSDALIKIMLRAGSFVQQLNLRGCIQLRDKWLQLGTRMTDECRNLATFSIEGCRIDRSAIHYFLLRNPRLVQINMPGMQNINNSTMRIIANGCPQLEFLNIDWCINVDTKGLMKVVEACPKLNDLRASEVRGFDDQDFMLELFKRNTLERLILTHCESLTDECLQILAHGIDPEIDPLTDQTVVPPRLLRHLDVSKCRFLTDKGVKALAYNVPFLEGFRVSQCNALTDDALTGILKSTPRLTHLEFEELDELTNATLLTLAKDAPGAATLEHLSISYCENLGDTGMLQVLKACPNLRTLALDNTRISDLVLMEAAALVRRRGSTSDATRKPTKGLSMVVFDCQNVTWAGVREILSKNTCIQRYKPVVRATGVPPVEGPAGAESAPAVELVYPPPAYPMQVIQLKCFYGWQMTVEEHYKRVVAAKWASASSLERKWADYMMANEEAGAGGAGARRRRRRAREAERAFLQAEEDDEVNDGGANGAAFGRGGRRRARSGGCVVM